MKKAGTAYTPLQTLGLNLSRDAVMSPLWAKPIFMLLNLSAITTALFAAQPGLLRQVEGNLGVLRSSPLASW